MDLFCFGLLVQVIDRCTAKQIKVENDHAKHQPGTNEAVTRLTTHARLADSHRTIFLITNTTNTVSFHLGDA